MEVHHHANIVDPDNHRHSRKWTHYFWEFLMLFLAVTLGFFVENQREHFIERQRARQYAASLIEDLKIDSSELNQAILDTRYYALSADTLLSELDKPINAQNDTILQQLTYRLIGYNFYDPTLSTYNQIKNSGTLRYFNMVVIKKLNFYETAVNYILKISNQHLEFRTQHLLPLVFKIQNTRFIRALNKEITYSGPVFVDKPGKQITEQLYPFAHQVRQRFTRIVVTMEAQKKKAEEIIELLKKYGK